MEYASSSLPKTFIPLLGTEHNAETYVKSDAKITLIQYMEIFLKEWKPSPKSAVYTWEESYKQRHKEHWYAEYLPRPSVVYMWAQNTQKEP